MTAHTTDDGLDPVFLLADTDPAAMKSMNSELIAAFRASGGNVGGSFTGVPLLLLTTIGSRSRLARTTPVNYTRTGDAYVVIASKSGAATHPDWYHNLRAHPDATIEVGGQTLQVRARETSGAERDALFHRQAEWLPNFRAYQRRTARQLPVIVLDVLAPE